MHAPVALVTIFTGVGALRTILAEADGGDPVLAIEEGIQEADVPVAAQADDVGDVFFDEVVDDDLGAFVLGHGGCTSEGHAMGGAQAPPIVAPGPS